MQRQGKILSILLLLLIVVNGILVEIYKNVLYSPLQYVLWIVTIIILVWWIIWLQKNTTYSQQQPQERLKSLDEIGFFSSVVKIGYVLGVVLILVGIIAFMLDSNNKGMLIGTSITGVLSIIGMFIASKQLKKK